jgi:hypothetical protein
VFSISDRSIIFILDRYILRLEKDLHPTSRSGIDGITYLRVLHTSGRSCCARDSTLRA